MIRLSHPDKFENRHIGSSESEISRMIKICGVESLDQLIDQTIPEQIRLKNSLNLSPPVSEHTFIEELKKEVPVQTGQFGASMEVSILNDGPVTFLLER